MVSKKPTAAQRAALERGRAKRDANRAEREKAGHPDADRWARVLSGQLSVRDLDDEEIRKGRVRNKRGFEGRAPSMPSHLQQQFQHEVIRRAKNKIIKETNSVTKALVDIAMDDDVPVAQRIKVLMYLQDRQLGRAPETVRIEGASAFDQVTMEALGLDRDMDAGAETVD